MSKEEKKKKAAKSISELAAHAKRNVPDVNAYQKQEAFEKKLVKHLQKSPTVAALYEPYRSMSGDYELAYFCVENQCDQQRTAYMQNAMTRISNKARDAIRERDLAINGELILKAIAMGAVLGVTLKLTEIELREDEKVQLLHQDEGGKFYFKELTAREGDKVNVFLRVQTFTQKKWLMAHDGSYGERNDRKVESERVGKHIFSNYTNAVGVRNVLADAHSRGLNRHDMTDAFLQSMEANSCLYAFYCSHILPRRRPGEVRSDTPILTDEQMHQGGTIRSFALDPGTRSIGFTGTEWTGMQTPPGNRPSITGLDTEPCFRVLLMELIDLEAPFSDVRGHALLSYSPNPLPGPVMVPDYMEDTKKIEDFFPPLSKQRKPRQKKKTAAPDVPFPEDDTVIKEEEEEKPVQKPKKPRKRLKKLDGSALREDVNMDVKEGGALLLIDLTSDAVVDDKEDKMREDS